MGELYALAAAVVWSCAVILFRRSGETVAPLAMNLFRVAVSGALFLVLLAVTRRPLWGVAPLGDYLILMASGIIAIAISDTLFHMALNRVGAGINAIIDTLYSPFVMLCAWLMLGETIRPLQMGGMVLVISAVLVASRARPPAGASRQTLVAGMLFGVGAMATIAFGIVLAKPVLQRSDVVWATAVRQFGSLLVLVPAALIDPRRKRLWRVFRPGPEWRFTLPGTLLGSFIALMFWIAGMKHTTAGAAAILNQTSTLFIIGLATVFLGEPFSWRRGLALVLALGGILLVVSPTLF
ncbi:DMT family transporter [bacterium]|nr:DMT family transporter [bacterium]